MGQSAAETVSEIEHVRDELDDKMRELSSRLPAPAVLAKRVAGIAVGGGMSGTVFWFAVRRFRNRKRAEVKGAPEPRSIELALPDIPEAWRPVLIYGAVAWVFLRLAQLRETRRTNRLLAMRTV